MFGVVYLWVKHKLRRVSQVKAVEVWSGEVRKKKKKKHDNHHPQPPEGQRSSPDVFFFFRPMFIAAHPGTDPENGGMPSWKGYRGGGRKKKPTDSPLQIKSEPPHSLLYRPPPLLRDLENVPAVVLGDWSELGVPLQR